MRQKLGTESGRRCLFLKRRNILTSFYWNGGLSLHFITKQHHKRNVIETAAFPVCAEAKLYRLGGVLREKKEFFGCNA